MNNLTRLTTTLILVTLLAVAWTPSAEASDDLRLFMDADTNLLRDSKDGLTLRPMARTEQRFRTHGLVMLKLSGGLRSDVLPWLVLQGYYAHRDLYYDSPKHLNMAVFDLIPHVSLGPVSLADRSGNEWHKDSKFYRYRNQLKVSLKTPIAWLKLFAFDEVRADSDAGRINLNDAGGGATFRVSPTLSLCGYYDLESNRRSKPTWKNTHVAGFLIAIRE